jgi:hypothetical protein
VQQIEIGDIGKIVLRKHEYPEYQPYATCHEKLVRFFHCKEALRKSDQAPDGKGWKEIEEADIDEIKGIVNKD